MALEIISELFYFINEPCNLPCNDMLQRENIEIVYFGTKIISFPTPEM